MKNNSKEAYIEIWDSIESEVRALNRSKHRKRKSRKILFVVLSVLVFGGLWFTISNEKNETSALKNSTSHNELKAAINEKKAIINPEETCLTTTPTRIPTQIRPDSKMFSTNNIPSSVSASDTKNFRTNTIDLSKKIGSTSKTTVARKITPNSNILLNKTLNQGQQPSFYAFPKEHSIDLDSTKSSLVVKNSPPKNKPLNFINLKRLPTFPISYLEITASNLLTLKKIPLIPLAQPITVLIVEKKWSRPIIATSSGLSYVDKRLAMKEENLIDLLHYRKATERTLYATHYGLTYTLEHHSNFKLIGGINYTSITEAYNFSQTIVDTIFVDGLEKVITYLDGTTKEVYGKASIKRTTQTEYEYFHKYNLIELPLLLGYDKQWRSFKLGCQAGIITNISLQNSGKRVDIAGKKQAIDQLGYLSNIGLGYYAGVSLQKNISPNLIWSIAPSMRIYPDISNSTNLIQQKYKLYGLNVSLGYRL